MAENDLRLKATATIWGIATAMMAVSIPASDITHSPGIPGLVIIAAAVSTLAVWAFGGNRGRAGNEASTQKQLQELEARLANLEGITNFEHKLLDKKYATGQPIPAPISPPMPVDSAAPRVETGHGAARPVAS